MIGARESARRSFDDAPGEHQNSHLRRLPYSQSRRKSLILYFIRFHVGAHLTHVTIGCVPADDAQDDLEG
jgi:hypothetical protein